MKQMVTTQGLYNIVTLNLLYSISIGVNLYLFPCRYTDEIKSEMDAWNRLRGKVIFSHFYGRFLSFFWNLNCNKISISWGLRSNKFNCIFFLVHEKDGSMLELIGLGFVSFFIQWFMSSQYLWSGFMCHVF